MNKLGTGLLAACMTMALAATPALAQQGGPGGGMMGKGPGQGSTPPPEPSGTSRWTRRRSGRSGRGWMESDESGSPPVLRRPITRLGRP